jgi:hypothetical protein
MINWSSSIRGWGAIVVSAVLGLSGCAGVGTKSEAARSDVRVWQVDSVRQIAGRSVEVLGAPQVGTVEGRKAVQFDGVDDGLFVTGNPLQGLAEFTIEVLVRPEAGGAEEQRFVHAEDASGRRMLFELRARPDGTWCLDTFLFSELGRLTLIDRTKWHAPGRWYRVAITYRDGVMVDYVDGEEQSRGALKFSPMGEGRTSLGVRQNRVSWFKGSLAEIRVYPRALDAREMGKRE